MEFTSKMEKMEDKYLDKKFKDILENPPPFEPDSAAINDMKRRLNQADVKSRRSSFGFWWLLPLLLIPLVFSSVFFYTKYQILNDKLNELNIIFIDFLSIFIAYFADVL